MEWEKKRWKKMKVERSAIQQWCGPPSLFHMERKDDAADDDVSHTFLGLQQEDWILSLP